MVQESPVVIVTGAGSGIGRATAELLASEGCRVALVGRQKTPLAEVCKEITGQIGAQHKPVVISADISRHGSAKSVVDRTLQEWGRIDALVNNAAALFVRPIEQNDEDVLVQTFLTNVFGPAYLIARAWPTFVKQRSGCVVNVSSIATVDPFPGLSVYAASKGALEVLTRAVVVEGRAHGIRGFTVAPGAVETQMLRQVMSEKELPPQRTHDPADVARVIVECIQGKRDDQMGQPIFLPNR